MKAVIPLVAFAARHLLIVPFAAAVGCILWTIFYGFLFVLALVTNQGLGGPLAYPAGIFVILAAAFFVGWGIFAPASAIGAVFCRLFGLPRLAAIPVVIAGAFALSYLLHWAFIEALTTHSMVPVGVVLKNFALFLAAPLGAYWWVTEGPGALFDAFRRWLRRRRHSPLRGDAASRSRSLIG